MAPADFCLLFSVFVLSAAQRSDNYLFPPQYAIPPGSYPVASGYDASPNNPQGSGNNQDGQIGGGSTGGVGINVVTLLDCQKCICCSAREGAIHTISHGRNRQYPGSRFPSSGGRECCNSNSNCCASRGSPGRGQPNGQPGNVPFINPGGMSDGANGESSFRFSISIPTDDRSLTAPDGSVNVGPARPCGSSSSCNSCQCRKPCRPSHPCTPTTQPPLLPQRITTTTTTLSPCIPEECPPCPTCDCCAEESCGECSPSPGPGVPVYPSVPEGPGFPGETVFPPTGPVTNFPVHPVPSGKCCQVTITGITGELRCCDHSDCNRCPATSISVGNIGYPVRSQIYTCDQAVAFGIITQSQLLICEADGKEVTLAPPVPPSEFVTYPAPPGYSTDHSKSSVGAVSFLSAIIALGLALFFCL